MYTKYQIDKKSRIQQYQVLVMMANNRNSCTSRGNKHFGKNSFPLSIKAEDLHTLRPSISSHPYIH